MSCGVNEAIMLVAKRRDRQGSGLAHPLPGLAPRGSPRAPLGRACRGCARRPARWHEGAGEVGRSCCSPPSLPVKKMEGARERPEVRRCPPAQPRQQSQRRPNAHTLGPARHLEEARGLPRAGPAGHVRGGARAWCACLRCARRCNSPPRALSSGVRMWCSSLSALALPARRKREGAAGQRQRSGAQ